ncbi:hypothetical protein F5Y19DRAFT_440628 [Xylariaceae sp. FL1651]|nr:hypothetical protein F5Y19DRAFT_440628 [Xylariaceae sp. FL1651]
MGFSAAKSPNPAGTLNQSSSSYQGSTQYEYSIESFSQDAFYDQQGQLQPPDNHQSRPPSDLPPLYTPYPQHLQKPIIIPATASSLGSPFLRAYPPSLEAFQISREFFIEFLDGLNRVAVKSPPLQVLGLVGDIVSFVPLATTQMVGNVVSATATLGAAAASKGAVEIYLRRANQETFAPRGLKVEVAKLEAVAKVIGIPILDATGKIPKDAQLLEPMQSGPHMQTVRLEERWLQALEPWIAHLDVDSLPLINMDTNVVGRLHTLASERERKKTENKITKDRSKAYNKQQKDAEKAEEDRAKDLAKLERDEQKARSDKRSHKLDDKLQKIDEERRKVESKYQKEMAKVAEDFTKDDKESKVMKKVLWLVIRNIDTGSGPVDNSNMRGEY